MAKSATLSLLSEALAFIALVAIMVVLAMVMAG
jgi:hypothetical protein